MATIIEGGSSSLLDNEKKLQTILMINGILDYVLDELPETNFEVQCFINGIEVNFTLTGTDLHIDEYTAGTIETDWELKVYYFKKEI